MECKACKATTGFKYTIDRIVHVTNGHIGRVVDSEGFDYYFDTHKGKWTGKP